MNISLERFLAVCVAKNMIYPLLFFKEANKLLLIY